MQEILQKISVTFLAVFVYFALTFSLTSFLRKIDSYSGIL
jgi:hypothetical protein